MQLKRILWVYLSILVLSLITGTAISQERIVVKIADSTGNLPAFYRPPQLDLVLDSLFVRPEPGKDTSTFISSGVTIWTQDGERYSPMPADIRFDKLFADPERLNYLVKTENVGGAPVTLKTFTLPYSKKIILVNAIDFYANRFFITSLSETLLQFTKCRLGNVMVEKNNTLWFKSDTISSLTINGSETLTLRLDSCIIKSLKLSNDTLSGQLTISNTILPDTISLQNVNFRETGNLFDFNEFENIRENPCILRISGTDISILNFNYKYFTLDTSVVKNTSRNERLSDLYTRILDMQKKYGYTDGEEKADIEFKRFRFLKDGTIRGYVSDFMEHHWWNYGYSKELIIRNSILLMMFFYLINLFLYKKLIHEVYVVKEFTEQYDKVIANKKNTSTQKASLYALYCLVYTGFIFWGLRISMDAIRFKNIRLALWIILQYLIGIICVAYLANYILSR